MKLKFLLLFFFIVLKAFSQATYESKGTITDTNNKPIEYAHLYLEGSKMGTVTNENGKFSLKISTILCFESFQSNIEI